MCSTTLQSPYSYQQIEVRSQPVASITKKHGGMQHPRPVVQTIPSHVQGLEMITFIIYTPTKSGHPKSDRR